MEQAVNPAVAVPAVGGQDTGAGSARPGNVGNQPPPLERGVAHATWPAPGPGILPAIGQQFRLLQQAMVSLISYPLRVAILHLELLQGHLDILFVLQGNECLPGDT